MLYKYLFYSVSYLIKKYDKLWNVGEVYFIGGAIAVGVIIAISLLSILDLIGLFINKDWIWSNYKILSYLPITLGLLSSFYFGYKKRHENIYMEIDNLNQSKKKVYLIINIVHVITIFFIYFSLGQVVRELNLSENDPYANFLIKILGIQSE